MQTEQKCGIVHLETVGILLYIQNFFFKLNENYEEKLLY